MLTATPMTRTALHRHLAVTLLLGLGSASLPAWSLTAPAVLAGAAASAAAPIAAWPADAALLQTFGARAGLQRLADDFVERLLQDGRIGHFFKDVKPKHLKQQLADQFCQVLAGGCVYDGETMKNSHAELKITRADFNALVEVLQLSMDAQGIPFAEQNKLLARLAPMHRDIITR